MDGQLNGTGLYTWADGCRYNGMFALGQRDGRGTFVTQGNEMFFGEFVEVLFTLLTLFTLFTCGGVVHLIQALPRSFAPIQREDCHQSGRLRFKWVQYLNHTTTQMNHKSKPFRRLSVSIP